jgi:hypothetical protein
MSGNHVRVEVGSVGIVLLSPTQKGGYRWIDMDERLEEERNGDDDQEPPHINYGV